MILKQKEGIRGLKGEKSIIWLLSFNSFPSRTKEAFWREGKKVQTTGAHGNHSPGIPPSGSQCSRNGAQVNYPATHCSNTGQLFPVPWAFSGTPQRNTEHNSNGETRTWEKGAKQKEPGTEKKSKCEEKSKNQDSAAAFSNTLRKQSF